MRISTIIAAALGPAGIMCAANGFLDSCSKIGLTNLEGDPGHSIMLQAYCKVDGHDDHWTQLDLNTCFGWSADSCNFISPPSGHFTDSCTSCSSTLNGEGDDSEYMFGCRGPCNGRDDVFEMFDLNSYVGNVVGTLVC